MKQLDYFINEKLKVNSKSTIKNTTTDIANYLGIDIKYAKEIDIPCKTEILRDEQMK